MKKLIFFSLALCAIANYCSGNCPSGNCPICVCGTATNPQSISYWCSKYTWNQACCQCIVTHESGGNANAINYESDNSYDAGLWQINQINWGQCNGGNIPCTAQSNLNCAINIYNSAGNSWKLWAAATQCGCY